MVAKMQMWKVQKRTKCVEGLVEADGSCTLGSADTARRTIHMTHYVLGIHNCPTPPQTTCSGGRPIAPTAMWERATGRFESPAATDFYTISFVSIVYKLHNFLFYGSEKF